MVFLRFSAADLAASSSSVCDVAAALVERRRLCSWLALRAISRRPRRVQSFSSCRTNSSGSSSFTSPPDSSSSTSSFEAYRTVHSGGMLKALASVEMGRDVRMPSETLVSLTRGTRIGASMALVAFSSSFSDFFFFFFLPLERLDPAPPTSSS